MKKPFQPGVSGNPAGRPRREKADSVIAKCQKLLLPFASELVERAVESALTGNEAALVAVLNVYASVMQASTAELQATAVRHQRPNVKAPEAATS